MVINVKAKNHTYNVIIENGITEVSEHAFYLMKNIKNISLGKAIGGATLFGGIGLAAGFLGKSEKKVEFYCRNCGKTFKR